MNGCNNYFELKFVEEIAAIIMAGFLLIVIICMMIKDWLQQKKYQKRLRKADFGKLIFKGYNFMDWNEKFKLTLKITPKLEFKHEK